MTFDPDKLQNYSGFVYSGWYVVETSSATRPEWAGVASTTIDKHGTTVIDLYYDRKTYEVHLDGDGHVATLSWAGYYAYGANVTVDMTAKEWYHFVEWRENNE